MPPRTLLRPEETPAAIVTICIGVGFLVLNDAIAKLLTSHYEPAQIIFVRNMIAAPLIAAAIYVLRGSAGLRTQSLHVHALRGVLMFAGAYLYFRSLAVLPLAEATALVFSAPIFITVLSVPLLGETVGWRRWGAVLVGFLGVLIIVQPGGAAFQPAALLVLATAVLYALFMISARWIGRDEGLWTMMLFVVLFPGLYAAPFAVAVWTPLRPEDVPHFLGMAVLGSLGITLIGQAFRMAPAAIVAPFDYTAIVWAAALGWLIWGDLPSLWTYVGAAIIIASGIFILLRGAGRAR
jgi:drug/metabolite transporter (DMT)-like permease